MAFSSVLRGETAGVGGAKKLFGTWNAASVTAGTITWGPSNITHTILGGGIVQSTAATTAWSTASCRITNNTLVIECESSATGWWWVEFQ